MGLPLGAPRLLAQLGNRLRIDDIQIVWEISSFKCTDLLLSLFDQQLRTCSIKASEMLAAIDKSRRNVRPPRYDERSSRWIVARFLAKSAA